MAREQVGTYPSRPTDTVDVEYVLDQLAHIPGVSRMYGEIPTGVKDGTNTVFSLTRPFQANTTEVFRNGLRETLGLHYFESGASTIIFDTAPLADDDISVDYTIGTVA